jgi:hypothetical protein
MIKYPHMGNLSEHFNYKDFACRCGQCRGQAKIHLGLVGALEAITEHFKKSPRILEAFRCEALSEKLGLVKKNCHRAGKAAHICLEGIALQELFKFSETLPEIRGLGFYPKENIIHIDTRTMDKNEEKDRWAKDDGKILPLTPDLKAKYNLL